MLKKVFIEQWRNPVKNDWTEEVKLNLIEFKLNQNWENLKEVSYNVFKNRVEKMGQQLEFERLMKIKVFKSKLSSLNYYELKIQDYLNMDKISLDQALAIFAFRTRMVSCDGNYKSGIQVNNCPLCSTHLDLQELLFECSHLKKIMVIQGNYTDVFGDGITYSLAKTLRNIWIYREEYRKKI